MKINTLIKKLYRIFLEIVIAILIGVVLLIIEYKTGYFADKYAGQKSVWVFIFILSQVILFFSTEFMFITWIQAKINTRERFSLSIALFSFSLTMALLASFFVQLFPWHLFIVLSEFVEKKEITIPSTSWAENVLLFVLYSLVLRYCFYLYQRWNGLKSIHQYKKEERGEPLTVYGLLIEAFGEIKRIAFREELKIHTSKSLKDYITPLDLVNESLAWRDQAKELLRLSSSVYDFKVGDWHDKPGCWLGLNTKTNLVVCLIPVQSQIEINKEYFDYLDVYQKISSTKVGEIVIALKKQERISPRDWRKIKIRIETESSLLNNLVDFKDYQNDIRRRVANNRMMDSDLTIKDVYVPSSFKHLRTDKLHGNIEDYLLSWLDEPSQRQIALLAEYGQGKSTAALMLTYHLICESEQLPSRIPILIELRGRSPRNQSRLGLLGDWASKYRIDPQALERLLDAGRLLIIFEGFDEMALVGDSDMRIAHFKTLWNFCYPKAKILITGRPNFFLDEDEMNKALGIYDPIAGQPYSDALRLEPFVIKQIKKALRARKPSIRNQICSFAERNPRFLEVIGRPSLLHLVSELWEEKNLAEKVESLNSAYVIGLFIRNSYLRQGLKESDLQSFSALNTREREFFMSGIASFMVARGLPNQITGKELNEAIEALLQFIPDAVSSEASSLTGEVDIPLRQRILTSEYGVENVKTDVRACGILVDDPSSIGTFRFGHKSFMEYLFASILAEAIIDDDSIVAVAAMRATQAEISNVLDLPVSIEFLSELVQNKFNERRGDHGVSVESDLLHFEKEFASKLFYAISGKRFVSRFFNRIYLTVTSINKSTEKISNKLIKSIVRMFTSGNFFLYSLLLIAIGAMIWIGLIGEPSNQLSIIFDVSNNPLTILISVLGVFVSSLFLSKIFSDKGFATDFMFNALTISREKYYINIADPWLTSFELWNYLCKKINIRDSVLREFTGLFLFPWCKDLPYDYFIPDFSEKQKVRDEIEAYIKTRRNRISLK